MHKNHDAFMHRDLNALDAPGTWYLPVACRGGAGGCDGPGHPPWGASKGPVFFKKVGK